MINNSLNRSLLLKIVIVILLLGVGWLGVAYSKASKQVEEFKAGSQTSQQNKIIAFGDQFVEKILKATGEVDFDTRLKLENDVRELNDKEILDTWQKFTSSTSENEAQAQVKNLLGLVFQKLK